MASAPAATDTLPIPRKTPGSRADQSEPSATPPPVPRTILIVDDDLGPREALRQILTPTYRVVTAQNGQEALEQFDAHRPDMVISDIRMPVMSGTELMTALRRRAPDTPFVLLTGYATIESAQAAVREGAFDYISKPYHVRDIRSLVVRALAQADCRAENRRSLARMQAVNALLEREVRDLYQKASLGELSAEMVHDLNSPMSVLCGYISLLEETIGQEAMGSSSESREVLDTMKAQIEHCIALTRRFLDYARNTRQAWDREDVNEVLRDTIFVLRGRMRSLRVNIVTALAEDLPETWIQPTPLQQVFFNLTTNALDALADGPEPRCLYVSTRHCPGGIPAAPTPDAIEITFEDNGPGVPDVLQERVFTPFFSTKPPGKGTGLGLSICRRIVQEHGGTIALESRPSGGARFTVLIPVRHGRPAATP